MIPNIDFYEYTVNVLLANIPYSDQLFKKVENCGELHINGPIDIKAAQALTCFLYEVGVYKKRRNTHA